MPLKSCMSRRDVAILLDMLIYARRVRDRLRDVPWGAFNDDEDLQLAATHMIQIVGEAASRSSPELRSQYPQIPWRAIIGMRQRIVHDYMRVRVEVVWDTVAEDIPPLIDILESLRLEEDER